MRPDPLDKKFKSPVYILGTGGYLAGVNTVAQAADLLLNRWPGSQSRKAHYAAREACLRTLQGLDDASKARAALEAAAKDAGVLGRPPAMITDFLPKPLTSGPSRSPAARKRSGQSGE